MASEMQERIARAIYEATPRNRPWKILSRFQKDILRERALAAMKEMLEPTSVMTTAGGEYVLEVGGIDCMHTEDRGPPWNIKGRETGARELFRAMLSHEIAAAEEPHNDPA
ncbi:hypothetical protein Xaut_3672 [Xanthobacter versatilis]|uniref:Uncharacterized protein n=1 Tax=Xanthobacter autotrophicus (strain ATCC BAA-1158 / Py2) TaxID=78245 RepID=A7ILK7_XANP2|nr:hypothetical protein Xaut_3672 [Xanthobacter autotrophicus Py2]